MAERKRRRKTICGKTRQAVAGKLGKAVHAHSQGQALPDERLTVERYLNAWLKQKKATLRPRAWSTYDSAVRLHLVPGLGEAVLSRLTPARIEEWFTKHHPERCPGA